MLEPILEFLYCKSPDAWLQKAVQNIEVLLLDHAKCEKKAASTALSLMFKYPQRSELQLKMAQLAREEVLHFEQVFAKIQQRGFAYAILSPSRYAGELHRRVAASEPFKLVDCCIVGAIIEARSCERFAALAPIIDAQDADLGKYYRYLLRSESRHYRDYLALAERYAPAPIDTRLNQFLTLEAELIEAPDPLFRFHSGVPQ